MSYGNVYIESDIKEMKKRRMHKEEILMVIVSRMIARYPLMSRNKAYVTARKIYEGKKTDASDWSNDRVW